MKPTPHFSLASGEFARLRCVSADTTVITAWTANPESAKGIPTGLLMAVSEKKKKGIVSFSQAP